jgi:hypothetical protein
MKQRKASLALIKMALEQDLLLKEVGCNLAEISYTLEKSLVKTATIKKNRSFIQFLFK